MYFIPDLDGWSPDSTDEQRSTDVVPLTDQEKHKTVNERSGSRIIENLVEEVAF